MHLSRTLSFGIVAGILTTITITTASAQTFASFLYGGSGNITYDNPTGNMQGSGIAVKFAFDATGFGVLPPGVGPSVGFGVIDATLDVFGHRTGNAVGSPGATQPYVIDSFHILRDTDGANLLSGSATPAFLGGIVGGTTLSLTSSLPPAGTVIFYNSDFVTFPGNPSSASLAWAFTEPRPERVTVAGNGNFTVASGPNLLLNPAGSFTFVPQGQDHFQFPSQAVPEPGTIALFASLGLTGSAGLWLKRRRQTSAKP